MVTGKLRFPVIEIKRNVKEVGRNIPGGRPLPTVAPENGVTTKDRRVQHHTTVPSHQGTWTSEAKSPSQLRCEHPGQASGNVNLDFSRFYLKVIGMCKGIKGIADLPACVSLGPL